MSRTIRHIIPENISQKVRLRSPLHMRVALLMQQPISRFPMTDINSLMPTPIAAVQTNQSNSQLSMTASLILSQSMYLEMLIKPQVARQTPCLVQNLTDQPFQRAAERQAALQLLSIRLISQLRPTLIFTNLVFPSEK